MASGSGLDLIRNEVPRLEGIRHSTRAHTDAVADANGAKLIPNHSGIGDGLFYALTETKQMTVASTPAKRVSGGCGGKFRGEKKDARVSFVPVCLVMRSKKVVVREFADGPDARDTNHCLLEVVIGTDALCGVQHGLHDGERRKEREKS